MPYLLAHSNKNSIDFTAESRRSLLYVTKTGKMKRHIRIGVF